MGAGARDITGEARGGSSSSSSSTTRRLLRGRWVPAAIAPSDPGPRHGLSRGVEGNLNGEVDGARMGAGSALAGPGDCGLSERLASVDPSSTSSQVGGGGSEVGSEAGSFPAGRYELGSLTALTAAAAACCTPPSGSGGGGEPSVQQQAVGRESGGLAGSSSTVRDRSDPEEDGADGLGPPSRTGEDGGGAGEARATTSSSAEGPSLPCEQLSSTTSNSPSSHTDGDAGGEPAANSRREQLAPPRGLLSLTAPDSRLASAPGSPPPLLSRPARGTAARRRESVPGLSLMPRPMRRVGGGTAWFSTSLAGR